MKKRVSCISTAVICIACFTAGNALCSEYKKMSAGLQERLMAERAERVLMYRQMSAASCSTFDSVANGTGLVIVSGFVYAPEKGR